MVVHLMLSNVLDQQMIFGNGDERGRCQEVKSCSVESDMNEEHSFYAGDNIRVTVDFCT